MLEELVSIRLVERQVEIVQSGCALVHRQLLDGGWVTGKGGNPYLLPLLNDKIELENPDRDADVCAECQKEWSNSLFSKIP